MFKYFIDYFNNKYSNIHFLTFIGLVELYQEV